MKNVIISPYAAGKFFIGADRENPKNYPYWGMLINRMNHICHVIQIGVEGEKQLVPDFRVNMEFKDIEELLRNSATFISVDNFLHHMAHYIKVNGIVLWGPSDPKHFGYPEQINLYKKQELFTKTPYEPWPNIPSANENFVTPSVVIDELKKILSIENCDPLRNMDLGEPIAKGKFSGSASYRQSNPADFE